MLPETKESLLAAIKVMELQIKTLKTLVENESEFCSGTLETTSYPPYIIKKVDPLYYPHPYNPNIPQKPMEVTCDNCEPPKETNPLKDIKVTTTNLNM